METERTVATEASDQEPPDAVVRRSLRAALGKVIGRSSSAGSTPKGLKPCLGRWTKINNGNQHKAAVYKPRTRLTGKYSTPASSSFLASPAIQ